MRTVRKKALSEVFDADRAANVSSFILEFNELGQGHRPSRFQADISKVSDLAADGLTVDPGLHNPTSGVTLATFCKLGDFAIPEQRIFLPQLL